MSRVVFSRFKALLVEPSALTYAERHDNIEAIYKKLRARRDTADVSALMIVLLWAPLGLVLAWQQVPGWGWAEWGLLLASGLTHLVG